MFTTIPVAAIRAAFDYEHGGFKIAEHRDQVLNWLWRGPIPVYSRPEDSDGLFRIWVNSLDGYFWPEDASEERWLHAV